MGSVLHIYHDSIKMKACVHLSIPQQAPGRDYP